MRIRYLLLIILLVCSQPTMVASEMQSGGLAMVNDITIDYDRGYIISAGSPIGASASDDYNMIIWHLEDDQYSPSFKYKTDEFTDFLSVDYFDDQIFVGGTDGKLFEFSYSHNTWNLTRHTILDLESINDLQVIAPNSLIAADVWEVKVRVNDTTVNRIALGTDLESRIKKSIYHYSIDQVIVRDFTDNIYGFDILTGQLLESYGTADHYTIRPGTNQIVKLEKQNITIVDRSSINSTLQRPEDHFGVVYDMKVSPNSQYLAVASDRYVELYDMTNSSMIGLIDNEIQINTIEWYKSHQFFTGDENGTHTMKPTQINHDILTKLPQS